MKFYVIISISKNAIAFSYYRDDSYDQTIRPFEGQWPAPLAIYSHGTSMEIGAAALLAAQRGVEGAYSNVFEIAQREGFFDYNGNLYPYNKLLFYAIEHTLQAFLRTTLVGSAGDIDANRSTISINLDFGPNMDNRYREYVLTLFRDGGYGNVKVLDYNEKAILALKGSLSKPDVLIVNSDGEDLYCKLYDVNSQKIKVEDAICLRGCGKDPRLERACKRIIGDIQQENSFADVEGSMDAIQMAAQQFLESDQPSINSTITLNDGYSCSYYLTRNLIDSAATAIDGNLRVYLNSALESYNVDISRTSVILKGNNTCNQYFRTQFSSLFEQVIELENDDKKRVQEEIIKELPKPAPQPTIGSSPFGFGQSTAQTPLASTSPFVASTPFMAPKQPTSPFASNEPLKPQVPKVNMSAWNKKKRVVIAEAKGKAREPLYNYDEAITMVKAFLTEAHEAGISDFDADCNQMIADWGKEQKCKPIFSRTVPPTKTGVPPVPPKQTPKSAVDMKWVIKKRGVWADAKGKVRGSNYAGAMELVQKFLSEAHAAGIHDFDAEMNQLIGEWQDKATAKKRVAPISSGSKRVPPVSTPAKPSVDVNKVIREARAAIAEANALHRKGDSAAAEKALKELQTKLHGYDIHDLDKKLDESLEACTKNAAPPCGPVSSSRGVPPISRGGKPVAPATSPARKLLEEGSYVEAKKMYAAAGDSKMAELCTKLIRAHSVIAQYKTQLPKATAATARLIITRLNLLVATYREANLDTKEIENLIHSYKSKK